MEKINDVAILPQEILQNARDTLVLLSLIDKSGQAMEAAEQLEPFLVPERKRKE